MTVRPIPPEQVPAAAEQVAKWGYPQPVGVTALRHGYWITDVPQTGILWFVEGPIELGHWCVHVCVAPAHRLRRAFDPEVYVLIRTVAGLLGASRLYAPLGTLYPGWARFLRTRGFDQQDAIGLFYDLPED